MQVLRLVLLLLCGTIVHVEHLLIHIAIVVVIASEHYVGKLEGICPLDAAAIADATVFRKLHANALLLKLQRSQLLLVHHHH